MLALAIFIATLVLVIWQPRGLGIGWTAMGGAVIDLAIGVIHWRDIPAVWHIVWNATFTFVALIVISILLDEAGFFRWAALHVARWGGGRGARLFVLLVVLGALVSALFANDGAALILTPVVIAMLASLEFDTPAMLAFIMACGFVADSGSIPLVISNLVNIISANYFAIPFDRYALVMVPVGLASLLATLLVLWLFFRRALPRRYTVQALAPPASVVRDPLTFRAGFVVLGLLLVAYLVAAPYHLPFSVLTGAAALALAGIAGRWHRRGRGALLPVRALLRRAPWQIVIFSLGMYVVVYGLHDAGLTRDLAALLRRLASHGVLAATVGTGFVAAALSSVMNNLPATLMGALAVKHASGLGPQVREAMAYANVVGCDLGPKFTPIGSLATLLWLHLLQRRGLSVSPGTYMRFGLLVTPPVLLVVLLCLGGWLSVVG